MFLELSISCIVSLIFLVCSNVLVGVWYFVCVFLSMHQVMKSGTGYRYRNRDFSCIFRSITVICQFSFLCLFLHASCSIDVKEYLTLDLTKAVPSVLHFQGWALLRTYDKIDG